MPSSLPVLSNRNILNTMQRNKVASACIGVGVVAFAWWLIPGWALIAGGAGGAYYAFRKNKRRSVS